MTELLLFIGGCAVGAVAVLLLPRRGGDLVQLAEAKLREAQAGARADLAALLAPVGAALAQVAEHNHQLEKARTADAASLRAVVESLKDGQQALQKETGRLAMRLYNPQTRGRWGELQLQNVIERAGMKSYCDFSVQQTSQGESGARRPDVVVNVPGGACIAVDAKTPMDAYDAILSAADDVALAAARAAHAAHIRRHVKELSAKAYWDRLKSPELVVLFLPGDHLLHSALEADAALLDDALAGNVLLATPATLMALLKAIAYGWRQETLAANAQQISAHGRVLYERLATVAGYVQKLGGSLSAAMKNYNEMVGSLEARVLPAARKFEELGTAPLAAGDKSALDLQPIDDVAPRALTAPEMAAPELNDSDDGGKLRKLG